MRKIFSKLMLLALFVMPMAFASAATTWNTTGNYVFTFNYLGSDYAHDVSLVQSGSDNLTGNGGNPAGGSHVYTWVLDSGTVSGNVVDFYAHYTASADAVSPLTTMHVMGSVALNGTMSGTWTDNYQNGNRSGTWRSTTGNAVIKTSSTVFISGNTSTGENQPGWLFNRDVTTSTPFEFNTASSSVGTGSLYVKPIGINASDKFVAENFINSPISDVNAISYDFKIGSGGTAASANQFYMNVYANFGVSDDLKYYDCRYNVVPTIGSTSGFTTVTFDPTQSYPVATRGGLTPSPFACPSIPADMNLLSAGSNIRMFQLNVGDTSASDVGLDGYLDKVVVSKVYDSTTFNFDPIPVVVIKTPTNEKQCKKDGWKNLTDENGKPFKNQGQCVSWVEHQKDHDDDHDNEHKGKDKKHEDDDKDHDKNDKKDNNKKDR